MRRSVLAVVLVLGVAVFPQRAHAGGTEFPADGARNLGRGGAGMARADDPNVMVRNPALLADLWDHQAMLGAHLLLVDSCFQPIGGYGLGNSGRLVVADFGDGPLLVNPPPNAMDINGNPLVGIQSEAYDEVCHEGPAPFLPRVALTMKLADDLGVGIGFFPPDTAALNQWGNRDGTIDTPRGKRPNPLRYVRSHLNTSYFSVLGGIGYRLADWLRVGLGLQWAAAAFQARTWTTPVSEPFLDNDVRTDIFGRDLFLPGVIASVQIKPIDALDVAIGFKWMDSVKSKAKLDLTAGAFGSGEIYRYRDANGNEQALGSKVPITTHNQPGVVESGPIWVPQASFGVRFADRLKPSIDSWTDARTAAGSTVEDSMQNERWDIEVDVVYYFTSVFDHTSFSNENAQLEIRSIDPSGFAATTTATIGDCLEDVPLATGGTMCIGDRIVKTEIGGKDQISVRVGGDYNVMPGFVSVRGGLSYETDGQDPESLNVTTYMYGRTGLHAGVTVRVADKTDISFGFAHFIQKEIKLQLNPMTPYLGGYKDPRFHFEPGLGVADANGLGADRKGDFDGNAGLEVPNAGQQIPGPYFVNAGSFYYNLDVLSVELTQHF